MSWRRRNNYLVYQELKAAADHPQTPLQTKYGDFFAACMNTEALRTRKARSRCSRNWMLIAEFNDKKKLAMLGSGVGEGGSQYGVVGVAVGQDQKDSSQQILQTGQGGLTLPDRDYYLLRPSER